MKTPHPAMMVTRRPMKSARSPAISAPKKVPADKIEVMRDFFQAGNVNASVTSLGEPGGGGSKPSYRVMKYGMPMTPLMYPESYPKKMPPNAAKAQRR